MSEDNNIIEDNMNNLYMTFTIEEQKYALSAKYIIEIIEILPITKVPFAPECIRGIINLRSNIIPVMDIRHRFGIKEVEYNSRTCIIIIENNYEKMGFIVDSVNEIINIESYEKMSIEIDANDNVQNFIEGVSNLNNDIQLILNCESIINIEKELEYGIEEQ